ncbi:MAG: PEP-CTERM sorting domain-containing protein [Phycisphaerae bacterium]|nr:PEP-CTERM sorting domain-containing protein [Gemmatimonadaceae bacterium]
MHIPHLRLRSSLTAFVALVLASAPAAIAQPLHFDDVVLNAAGFNSSPFTSYRGYTFENFGVLTSASPFGTGNNPSSPTNFAYGQAFGSSYIYRTDVNFNFRTAFLSFRQLDLDASPATITVRGYRAGDVTATFEQDVLLTNANQRFDFYFDDIEELEFETDPLQAGGRSAVMALDDVDVSVVPEPASIALVASGLAGILLIVRRRNGRKA